MQQLRGKTGRTLKSLKKMVFWGLWGTAAGVPKGHGSQMTGQLVDLTTKKMGTVVEMTGFGTGLKRRCHLVLYLMVVVVEMTGFGTGLKLTFLRQTPELHPGLWR